MIIVALPITPESRTLTISGVRRRISLAAGTWAGLEQIAEREGMSITEIVSTVHDRARGRRLRANLEVFVVAYFRAAADSPASLTRIRSS